MLSEQIYNEAEYALIGELLVKPSIYIDIACQLMPDDFAIAECRDIYDACIMLTAKDKPIDALTVLREIGGDEQHYKIFMVDCRNAVASTANYREHIRLVLENSKRRKAVSVCRELLENLMYDNDMDVCRETASALLGTFDGLKRDTSITAADGFSEILSGLSQKKEYIGTGIRELDYFIKTRPGDFLGIGGRPSSGKTAFGLQMMLNMAKKHKCLFFSLETGKENIFERMMSNYSCADYKSIIAGGMTDEDIEKVRSTGDDFRSLNFSVIEAGGYTVEQVESIALQKRAEIVFIDYLQLLRTNNGKSLYEQTTNISKELHTMAQKHKILVVVLIQLNRAGAGQPDMTSLRDSGQIEQDLDCLILLSTPNEQDERTKSVKIAKNKKGLQGTLELDFRGDIQRFFAQYNGDKPFD